MRKRLMPIVTIAFVWAVVCGWPASAQRQQPPRLIVINYTGAVITLSLEVKGKPAQPRGRLNPGASTPILGVSTGDVVTAEWRGRSRQKQVQLRYDQTYRGLQDTWTVQ